MKMNFKTLLAGFAVSLAAFAQQGKPNLNWWPDQLDLSPLRQHSVESNL